MIPNQYNDIKRLDYKELIDSQRERGITLISQMSNLDNLVGSQSWDSIKSNQ